MIKILNNIFKGLLVAFVIILTGGIFLLNVKISPNTSMVLVSSSLVNSIKTDSEKEEIENTKEQEKIDNNESVNETKEDLKEEYNKSDTNKEEGSVASQVETKESVEIEEVIETPTPTPKQSVPEANGSYNPNNETTTSSGVEATYTGLVTAYGPDCYGCYGSKTAMGDYVGEGNIYYNHPTYGTIRIVAGDRSILNKVVRITGLNISSEPVIAIVRDTGGDIGFNKPKGIILDLLFTSEKSQEVLNFGMQQATVEVLN